MKKLLQVNLFLILTLWLGGGSYYAQCSFSGLNPNYCTNSAPSTLTPGITGGVFSGAGITGSVFSPSVAGPGTYTINYNICSTTYSITSPTYSPILSATVGTSESLGDDQLSGAINIGFNFKFFCNTYTQYYISSNGYITFNANAGSGCCQGGSMPTGTTPDNLIAYAWVDLYPPGGGTITHTMVGTAPNRIQVISFNGIMYYNGCSTCYCCPITSQILLYETTNVIEIHTTSKPLPTASGYSVTEGIQNSGGTIAYPVPGRNASSTWTATNECYRWTPGASCNVNQVTTVSPSSISVVGNPSICVGSTASLTATGNTTYTWSTASNSNSIAVTPSTTQTYSVSGTNSYGCVANSVITVTVDHTPTVTATASSGSGVCPGQTVTVNGAGASSYTWTGGVPTITNGVAFSPTTSATYTVTGNNACGTASAAINVSIYPLPTLTPVASSASLCSGASLTLTGVGNSTAYVWSGGPGGITNGVGFYPSTSATYTVIGTSALSCTASATIPVAVVTTPSLAPTAQPALICIGKSSTLTATGASSYTWSGPTGSSTNSVFVATPTSSGISTYTIVRSNANCTTTQQINVMTNALPTVFAIVSPTIVCALNPATLAVGGAQTYTWTSPGNPPSIPSFTFSGSSPVVFPPVSTIYSVAASDGTCVNTTTVALAANPNPTITTTASSSMICSGQSVTVSASGGNNYTWTATSGTFYTQGITDTPTISTAYNVVGNNSYNCLSSAVQVVVVNPNPTITAVANKTLVCSGGGSTLTASGANTYTWSNSAFTNTTIVNPTNTITGPVIYTVGGTYTTTGCSTTATAQVVVFVPTLAISGNTNTCSGGLINLTASGGTGNSYSWLTPGNPPYGFSTLSTTLSAPAVFTVNAMTTSLTVSCPATKTIAVGIFFNPTITAVAHRTLICYKESVVLTAGGGSTYAWSNGANTNTVSVSPIVNTTYTVTGTDANGCVNTATVLVKVSGCVGIEELSANVGGFNVYPNPNEGEFVISSNGDAELTLVNELGQIVRTFILSGSNSYTVHVTDVSKGIYFLNGRKGTSQVNQKIVVTH